MKASTETESASRSTRRLPDMLHVTPGSLAARLAEAIIEGTYLPGTQLDEVGLARSFEVSRTPVREALRQLAATGLVEMRPNRGAVVAAPNEQALHQIFYVMAELEALCASLAAESMPAQQRAELEDLHQRSGEAVRRGDLGGYSRFNLEFHEAIYAGSANRYLADLTRATHLRLAPFRKAQFRSLGRLAASFAEHNAVLIAIQRGHRSEAADAMRLHIGTVEQSYQRLAI